MSIGNVDMWPRDLFQTTRKEQDIQPRQLHLLISTSVALYAKL